MSSAVELTTHAKQSPRC